LLNGKVIVHDVVPVGVEKTSDELVNAVPFQYLLVVPFRFTLTFTARLVVPVANEAVPAIVPVQPVALYEPPWAGKVIVELGFGPASVNMVCA
jgi:hypothetical protein